MNDSLLTADPVKLLDVFVLRGANYYSGGPVIVMKIDLAAYDEVFTSDIPGFYEKLKAAVPTLYEHHCSVGREGGFFERVKEGTLLGHVTEHAAIELQSLAGMDAGFGKTRMTLTQGIYNVVFRFLDEQAGIYAGKAALHLVNALLKGRPLSVSEIVQDIRRMRKDRKLSPLARAVKNQAEERKICCRISETGVIRLGTGRWRKRIDGGFTSETGHLAVQRAEDVSSLTARLKDAGLPVISPAEGQASEMTEVRALVIGGRLIAACESPPDGEMAGLSQSLHPMNRVIAERGGRISEIDLADVRLLLKAPDAPVTETAGGITRIVPNPDLNAFASAIPDDETAVARGLLNMLFPKGSRTGLSLISVTGSFGKAETVSLIHHCLTGIGKNSVAASSFGLFYNGVRTDTRDMTHPEDIPPILTEPGIDCAVLETACEGILSHGLGYEWADIGIVLNLHDRAVPCDYIRETEDIAYAKSVVPEQVREDGYSVLNADHPLVLEMAARAGGQIILFSRDYYNSYVRSHTGDGGLAVVKDRDEILIFNGRERIHLFKEVSNLSALRNLPETYASDVLLSAVSALYGFGLSAEEIRQGISSGLRKFEPHSSPPFFP